MRVRSMSSLLARHLPMLLWRPVVLLGFGVLQPVGGLAHVVGRERGMVVAMLIRRLADVVGGLEAADICVVVAV